MTPPKLVFAGASADRYGADAVLLEVAAHLSTRGADCLLVLPEDGPGRRAAESRGLRVRVLEMPVLRKADLHGRGLARLAASLLPGWRSHVRLLREERPDAVWANTVTVPLWLAAARRCGLTAVCHSHETLGGSLWLRRALYLPLFLATRIVAVSGASRDDVVEAYGALADRIRIALNPSFAVSGPVPIRPGSEAHVVVIGRISARKGHEMLLDALEDPRLARLRPVVHVCGAAYRSEAQQAFEAAVRRRAAGVEAEIHFHGYVPIEEALSLGGIVVVPSTEPESCPLVVAEALTAGRALVASDIGGIPEIAGGAGLLVPPGRADALAEALARVVGDAPERSRLQEAGLERAGDLTADAYFAELDRFLDSLVRRPTPAAAPPLTATRDR